MEFVNYTSRRVQRHHALRQKPDRVMTLGDRRRSLSNHPPPLHSPPQHLTNGQWTVEGNLSLAGRSGHAERISWLPGSVWCESDYSLVNS